MSIAPLEWQRLFQDYNAQGLRFAGAILGAAQMREPNDAAKDVCQEAWTAVWRFARNTAHAKALFFYAIRIQALAAIHKRDVNEKKKDLQRKTVGPGWGGHANPDFTRAIEVMTCDSFEVWYLTDIRGFPRAEVAETLGVSKQVANGRLARARAALR